MTTTKAKHAALISLYLIPVAAIAGAIHASLPSAPTVIDRVCIYSDGRAEIDEHAGQRRQSFMVPADRGKPIISRVGAKHVTEVVPASFGQAADALLKAAVFK